MNTLVDVPAAARFCPLPTPFRLRQGGELRGAWLCYSDLGPAQAPAVVVLGGISAGRHAAAENEVPGWWPAQVGPGRPIDTARWRVLGIDWLGGAGLSAAPRPGESFPSIAPADQAAALRELLAALRIDRLTALVGCSYGGMVGLEFAASLPRLVHRLVVIGAAHRSAAPAVGGRAVQRAILELGRFANAPAAAVRAARQLALLGYRDPAGLDRRFAGGRAAAGATIGAWLDRRGTAFAKEWSLESYACLLESLDLHRVDPAAVLVPTWVVGLASDQLVPPALVRELAAGLPNCLGYRELATEHGHDGFLLEPQAVGALLEEVLS